MFKDLIRACDMLKIPRHLGLMVLGLALAGCQTQHSSQVIATAFNLSTKAQQQWMERGAPQDVVVQENITYHVEPNLRFDLYQAVHADQQAIQPTVVWIHGGGWISGSKTHARGYFKRLAAAGYNVIALEYPLAPQYIYPTQLKHIDQALEFLRQNAVSLNIDATRMYLAGDSAGANLASHYAALVTTPQLAKHENLNITTEQAHIKGLILHCGIYDLNAFVDTAPDEMRLVEWGVYQLVQAYTGEQRHNRQLLKQLSPIQHLTPNYPPVFISGGNKDFLTKSQSLPFVQALNAQNIPVKAVFYPDSKEWLLHEYQFFLNQEASQATLQKTLDFLATYTP